MKPFRIAILIRSSRSFIFIVLAALLLTAVNAPAQEPPELFIFQDNFWLNLHQFLRGEVYRKNIKAPPGLEPATLTESDRLIWNQALESYAGMAKRDLLFDELMRTIGNTLAVKGDVRQLPERFDPLIGADTRATLNAAAPIYGQRRGQAANVTTRHGSYRSKGCSHGIKEPWLFESLRSTG